MSKWLFPVVGILIIYLCLASRVVEGFQIPAVAPLALFQSFFNQAGCQRNLVEGDVWWWRKQPNMDIVRNDMAAYSRITAVCSGADWQHEFCIPGKCLRPATAPLAAYQKLFTQAGCRRTLTEGDLTWWRKQANMEIIKNDMAAYARLTDSCSGVDWQHDFCSPGKCVRPSNVPLPALQDMFIRAGCKRKLKESDVGWWRQRPRMDDIQNDMNEYSRLTRNCIGVERQHEFCEPGKCGCGWAYGEEPTMEFLIDPRGWGFLQVGNRLFGYWWNMHGIPFDWKNTKYRVVSYEYLQQLYMNGDRKWVITDPIPYASKGMIEAALKQQR